MFFLDFGFWSLAKEGAQLIKILQVIKNYLIKDRKYNYNSSLSDVLKLWSIDLFSKSVTYIKINRVKN